MDSIKDVLNKRGSAEPAEITVIKNYIQSRFKSSAAVTMQERNIVINVPSASLASTLRLHLPQLSDVLKTDKRLVIRIGK